MINEIRKFADKTFFYREKDSLGGKILSQTNSYRCIREASDPTGFGMEVRAEPYPNPCEPPSAGYGWFSKEEWVRGTLVGGVAS